MLRPPRRGRAALSLFGAASLGFLVSGALLSREVDACAPREPLREHAVFALLRHTIIPVDTPAAEPQLVITDPTALPAWIDDYALHFLWASVAFLIASVLALLAVAFFYRPKKLRLEADPSADGDTGPWLRTEPHLTTRK
jgi:hypothetical protein